MQDWYFPDVYIFDHFEGIPAIRYDIWLGYISYLNYPKSWIDVLIQKHLLCIKHRKAEIKRTYQIVVSSVKSLISSEIYINLNRQTSSRVLLFIQQIISLRVMNGDFMFNTASYMEDNACWILVVIICWKQVLIIYNGQNITHKHTKISLTRVDKQYINSICYACICTQ